MPPHPAPPLNCGIPQGGTYGGSAIGCAAAAATIDVIEEEGLLQNAAERGQQLARGLLDLAQVGAGGPRGWESGPRCWRGHEAGSLGLQHHWHRLQQSHWQQLARVPDGHWQQPESVPVAPPSACAACAGAARCPHCAPASLLPAPPWLPPALPAALPHHRCARPGPHAGRRVWAAAARWQPARRPGHRLQADPRGGPTRPAAAGCRCVCCRRVGRLLAWSGMRAATRRGNAGAVAARHGRLRTVYRGGWPRFLEKRVGAQRRTRRPRPDLVPLPDRPWLLTTAAWQPSRAAGPPITVCLQARERRCASCPR